MNMETTSYAVETFSYQSANGAIEAWLAYPVHAKNPPLIMFFRGGNKHFGAIDENKVETFFMPLVRAGFAVVGSQYSGGPNSDGADQYGGTDVQDSLALYEYIKKEKMRFDFSHLGVLGVSRGVMMALQAMRAGLPVSRAAFVGGLYDCRDVARERPALFDMWRARGVFDVSDMRELERRSPVAFASDLPSIPYLLLHSREDSRVAFSQYESMMEVLGDRAQGIVVDGDDHGLTKHKDLRDREIVKWFLS